MTVPPDAGRPPHRHPVVPPPADGHAQVDVGAAPEGWVPDVAGILAAADTPAMIETGSGKWLIGVDLESRLCGAVHRPSGPAAGPGPSPEPVDATRPPSIVAASGWGLEQNLGFPLGDDIHRALRLGTATLRFGERTTGIRNTEAAAESQHRSRFHHPPPAATVSVPGRPPISYAASLAQSRIGLRWEKASTQNPADLYRIDLVELGRAVVDGCRALTYRLCLNDEVLFAGDDIEVPANIELRSSETLCGLVQMLLHPEDDVSLNAKQQTFLARRSDEIAALVAEQAGPYQPGERVEVRLPDGRLLTGKVTTAIPAADGDRIRSYQWTPDGGLFTGAADGPRGTIVSPAVAVRATLLPPLTGPTPSAPASHVAQPVPHAAVP